MLGFEYRYSLGSDAVLPAKDYPINAAYEVTAKKGDPVKLNASGEVVAAVSGDAAMLGILESTSFEGLGNPAKKATVRIQKTAVYEVEHNTTGTKTSLTAADIGKVYDLGAGADFNKINLDDTTGAMCKVVGFNAEKKTAYVQLTNLIFG